VGRISPHRIWEWLVRDWQWPYAGLFAGCFLLVLTPVWFHVAGLALTLVYVQLPLYLLHQYEEHAGDRFRLFVNARLAAGREALTPAATFWTNSLGVWGLDLIALYLACFVDLALGLLAPYLAVVNGVTHLVAAVVLRGYNPGLATAVVLFLPVGGWSIQEIAVAGNAGWGSHALAAGVAVAIHVGLVVYIRRRVAEVTRTNAPPA
jgi:hypothetical protein